MDLSAFALLLTVCRVAFVRSDCVTYGQCGYNSYGSPRNCLYDGPPKQLRENKALESLKKLCPEFFTGGVDEPFLCCDADQVETLSRASGTPQLIVGRCPACWRNLRSLMCARACSPDMAEFEVVTATTPFVDANGTSYAAVTETGVAFNYNFMESIIASCRDVGFLGGSALDVICMSTQCTPEKLAEVLSSMQFGAPHKSDIYLSNSPEITVDGAVLKPFNRKTFPCEDAVISENEFELPCTCADCLQSCPVADFNSTNIEMVGLLTVTEFLVLVLAIAVFLSFSAVIVYNMWQRRAKKKPEKENPEDHSWTWQDRISHRFYSLLSSAFFQIGVICTTYPWATIVISLLCCIILTLGITHFEPTAEPVDLWGVSNGRCLREKEYFEKHFGPFYRTAQVILVPKNQSEVVYNGKTYGPVFRQNLFLELLDIEDAIKSISVRVDQEEVKLADVCFAPLSPENQNCTIQDVAQYFQSRRDLILQSDWMNHVLSCIDAPYNPSCLSPYLSPIFPFVAFGGVENSDYSKAKALSITILNNNYLSGTRLSKAKAWETAYLNLLKSIKSENFDIYFNAERSAEDGITEISKTDFATVVSSYVVMLVYMSIFLATFRSFKTALTDVRISLGCCCILMIILSVTCSFGFFSFLGFKTTLLVLEVTPFLLLAVGSGDNFIFVKNYIHSFSDSTDPLELTISANLRQIGPSLLLSSCAQFVAFGIGASVPVSSVKFFALYSSFAVLVKFCLQITFFVAVFTLDCKRQAAGRIDILFCVKQKLEEKKKFSILFQRIFSNYYCPVLFNKFVRPTVIVLFACWFIVSMVFVPRISIGLDLKVIFPDDSYTFGYLAAFSEYSAVGPPVYIVIQDGYNYSELVDQNYVCGTIGCSAQSVINTAYQAAKYPDQTSIAVAPTSWLDDFFSWISSEACCTVVRNTTDLCQNTGSENCDACPTRPSPFNQRPSRGNFNRFLLYFLNKNPDESCPKAGKALFAASVEIVSNRSEVAGATNFMAYSAVPRTTTDYIKALEGQRMLSDKLSSIIREQSNFTGDDKKLNPIFTYSYVDVFYEQYIGIMHSTMLELIYCVIGVFVVTLLLLGIDIQSSLVVLIMLIVTMAEMMGSMYFGKIDLNAISLVNLIMAIGIAVEFYVHIVRDFSITLGKSHVERAKSVVIHVGSFIFIGVTIPELVGVITMATAKSQMFRLYFFKMYLILIITCTLNGLVFLPVFLSFCGPPINESKLNILSEKCRIDDAKLLVRFKAEDHNELAKVTDTTKSSQDHDFL